MRLFGSSPGWPGWALLLEWKPQDLWIGVFWKRSQGEDACQYRMDSFDLWICLLPCVQLHFAKWW